MFSNQERCIYRRNQIGQVICQFRFPEILTIGANAPVDFQEAIRDEYPQYSARKEISVPQIMAGPGRPKVEQQEQTMNYQFVSEDNRWRVNLTSKFISFSCSGYTRWEEFAGKLDKPLANFISVYKPAYFERIGLRYINLISRKQLELEDVPFRELISSKYLGVLADEQVEERTAARSSVDAEFALRGGCRTKIHAGPGRLKIGQKQDPEVRFIFDQDLYMPGKIPVNLTAGALQTLHGQAYMVFRDAITEELHEAMIPEDV